MHFLNKDFIAKCDLLMINDHTGIAPERGDIVVIKSGGPLMTVSEVHKVEEDPLYGLHCTYFNEHTGTYLGMDLTSPEVFVLVPQGSLNSLPEIVRESVRE